jgi:predicted permease
MLTSLRNLLRALFRHDALNREMNDEMGDHVARATERLVARGLSHADAERLARREFGNVGVLTEQGRDARGASWVESLRGDLRFAVRSLRSSPVFTLVAVLSLAIGIGANTAIFSLLNAVMLRALPVRAPQELLQLTIRDSAAASTVPAGEADWTNPQWEAIRQFAGEEARFAVSSPTRFNLATGGEARYASSLYVNGDFFNALGVRPQAGRLLAAADDERGCAATVVAGEAFWESELGGRADAIGKSITLEGKPFTLIGVVPGEFFGVDVGEQTQLYVPICAEALVRGQSSVLDQRSNWWLRIMARPNPGVTAARLGSRLDQLSRPILEATVPPRYDAQSRAGYMSQRLGVAPAVTGLSSLRRQYSQALLVLMTMVGVILLISCANVANLLLARGAARQREFAVRVAIGAGRWRLVRQSLVESAVLAVAGTAAGLVFAAWASRLLVGMLGTQAGSRAASVTLDLSLDARLLAFSAIVCAVTVLLFGLAPAWRSTKVDPQSAMKSGGRGTIEGHSRFRFGKALVVAQTALALVLVVGAALLVTTFRKITTAPMGFDPDGVLFARVSFGGTSIAPPNRSQALAEIRRRIAQVPGVQVVSAAELTPVGGSSWNDVVMIEGGENSPNVRDRLSWFNQVDSGYFAAMKTRLVAGRDFGPDDTPTSPRVAVVNEAMAKQFFKDASPIGRVFYTEDMGRRGDRVTIIGVVENSRYRSIREEAPPIIYTTYLQEPAATRGGNLLVIRAASIPAAIEGIKSITRSFDPRLGLSFTRFSDQVARAVRTERMLAILSGVFGALALALAMIGLYGVMAYTVARRRVEIGIRVALGAGRGRVVRMILGDVGVLVGTGIVTGGAAALASVRLLGSLLYGVEPRDPVLMLGAALGLVGVAMLAGAIPARRAAALQPLEALRED